MKLQNIRVLPCQIDFLKGLSESTRGPYVACGLYHAHFCMIRPGIAKENGESCTSPHMNEVLWMAEGVGR